MDLALRLLDRLAARARARVLPDLVRALELKPGLRVLDVGGGTGHVAAALGVPVVVLEPDARRRAYGARVRPGLTFVDGRAERLPFPDEHLDRALFVLSLHHVQDPSAALREALRALRPGGLLVVHELDPSGGLARRVAAFERWHGHPAKFLAPEALAALAREAGFGWVEHAPVRRGYVLRARRP